jgi:DNA-binding transcriptional regulator YiaG
MAKIESVIKAEIVRLAKREMRSAFLPMKREVRQMSIRLSGLSKAISSLNRLTKDLGLEKAKAKLEASPEEVKTSRITPDRIRGLRKKLGISQREMGILTGASMGAVVSWERGKFKPRGDKKTALVPLRKLGKRKVKELLRQKTAQTGEEPQKTSKVPARTADDGKAQIKKAVRGRKPAIKRIRPSDQQIRKAASV